MSAAALLRTLIFARWGYCWPKMGLLGALFPDWEGAAEW